MRNLPAGRSLLLSVVLISIILPLAGCWDSNEPERMVYVHGMGVDYKNKQYTVYLQLMNPRLLAKSESAGGSAETKVEVGRATGKSLNEAIFNLYPSTQQRVFWGHIGFVAFTERALNNGAIKATIDLLDRYRETRYRVYMYATKAPLFDLLRAIPIMEMSSAHSRLSEPYSTFKQSSITQPVDMRELLVLLNEPPHEASIPLTGLAENTWKTDKQTRASIKIEGIATITDQKLKKTFTGESFNGLKWMDKDLEREELRIEEEGLTQTGLVVDDLRVKIKPVVHKSDIRFDISIEANCILREMPENKRLKEIAHAAEQTMRKQIKETYLLGIEKDIDVYRLSEVLYRKNVQAWKAAEKEGKVPLTKESLQKINVKVNVVHGSKQRKEPTIK